MLTGPFEKELLYMNYLIDQYVKLKKNIISMVIIVIFYQNIWPLDFYIKMSMWFFKFMGIELYMKLYGCAFACSHPHIDLEEWTTD